MPLSDSEQRILEEIEKNLYADDPAFARGVKRKAPRFAEFHRLRLGVLTLVAGCGLLLWFFFSPNLILGVLAFAAMVAGIVFAMRSLWGLAITGRRRRPGLKERTSSTVRQWEERFRNRYKRL
ncbi:MAG: DUF3040 domain-containing protein [Actinomycetota bacterium]|nr:DUF3040 domain-containing protein [Actinomycetota bacterium]